MTKNKNMICKTALNFPDHLIMYQKTDFFRKDVSISQKAAINQAK